MSDLSEQLVNLSPQEKRELLAKLMREKAKRAESEYPLSSGQKPLWFLYQLVPESAVNNVVYAAYLQADLDIQALQKAFAHLVERHSVLRTTYTTRKGEGIAQVHQNQSLYFQEIDVSQWSQQTIDNWIEQEADRPFDLEKGPVMRVNLLTQFSEAEQSESKKYILVLVLNHITLDFWSVEILLKELSDVYLAIKSNLEVSLPPLKLEYSDYVRWETEMLASQEGERLWHYWQKQLGGELPLLNLPTDRPRPPMQTYNGKSITFSLNEKLSLGLKELAKANNTTPYVTILAAFQVLLYRYTNQEDILIGSALVSRNKVEFERIFGYFINAVVLRGDLGGNPSFRELLARSRLLVLTALDHKEFPFSLLVERLQPAFNPSHPPIVQVGLAWDQVRQDNSSQETQKLITQTLISEPRGTNLDLSLLMFDQGETFSGVWKYNPDLFEAATIERLSQNFQILLAGIVANPQEKIAQLPLLTAEERHQILVQWNNPITDYPLDKCIHQLFEEQVEKTPDAVALVFENQQLTYGELNNRANQLAHYLQSLGVAPEVLVGVCVERSLEMVVGLLGILKAGGAYVPLDPIYPQERLALMVSDSQIAVVLTQQSLLEHIQEHQTRLICLDRDWDLISPYPVDNLKTGVTPQNLIYVIYTSGSTGIPKGVLVSHANVVRLLSATQPWFNFTSKDVWTMFHSYAFDFSVWELWGALGYGGKLIIVPHWVSRSPEEFYQLLDQERVTVLNQTPSAFRQLIQVEESANQAANLALRLVIFGGEALELQSLKPWFDRHGEQRPQLVNMYGITETTVHVTYRPLSQKDLQSKGSLIGCPIPDLQVYLLDQYQQLVPIGVSGEMYVGGAGVARGYLNRPELTKERFIPNPFRDDPNSRLYKTGDLARYLPNGDLEYLGRIDHQVKIRGFRIELGEIEAVLTQHPQVREALVIAQEDQPNNKRLVAYLVSNQDGVNLGELRNFLSQKLPDYMIPSAFVILAAFPLTPNGKIDRRALPKLDQSRPDFGETFVAPRNFVEEELVAIWHELLGVEKISIYDNFFELGGHSLLLTQVASRIRANFEIALPLMVLFNTPTVVAMSVAITEKMLEQEDEEDREQILKEVQELSQGEIMAMLKDKSS